MLDWFQYSYISGIIIGENSDIDAGSVVTKSIPQGMVAAVNQAKIIKNIYKNEI